MQQLKRVFCVVFALGSLPVAAACADPATPDDHAAGSLLRMFTDSGGLSVRSWMADYLLPVGSRWLSVHVNNEKVTIPAIDAAPGSEQAVDAITTASRPISGNAFQDFVKIRNEMSSEVGVGRAAVGYYVSSEEDYLGQQLGARYDHDLDDGGRLNLSFGTSVGWDRIDPLADDDTDASRDHKTTLHLNTVATQILSPSTMMRYGVEFNVVRGLQHNPYRNVYAGGSIVPERHPDERQRKDAFVRLNHNFRGRTSLRIGYRFYNDDWGIDSHELGSKLSQYITQGLFAAYEYRYYTQTTANFYRPEYETVDGIDGYRTGDYRMGPLGSHLFGVSLEADLAKLASGVRVLGRMSARLGYERYFNSNNYSADILETGLDYRF